MTDPQQPPSGAVPPVPPVPRPADEQPQFPPPSASPVPPTAPPASAHPAPPAHASAPPVPPAYQGSPPTYPTAPPAYQGSPPTYPTAPPAYQDAAPAYPTAPAYPAAPPGAYQVPVGGYAAPAGAYQVPGSAEKKSGLLGILSLIFSLISTVVAPIIVGFAVFAIGRSLPGGFDATPSPDFFALLSPVRDQVLWAEIAFWTGTIFGIAAIVTGILAIRKKQARNAGIAGLAVAIIGPFVFGVVVSVALSTGTAAGLLP